MNSEHSVAEKWHLKLSLNWNVMTKYGIVNSYVLFFSKYNQNKPDKKNISDIMK